MRRPRALRPGDRIAIVAPASQAPRAEFDAGVAELRRLGFEPVFDENVFDRTAYLAGPAVARTAAFQRAWSDPGIAALVAVRGGFGSVHLLPLLDPSIFAATPKAFIGYSDNTSILSWLTLTCGIVAFHGPMLQGRFARGEEGYDRDTFERCLTRAEPAGEITHPQVEVVQHGDAAGMLTGGTLTQLTGSLGTPYAFDPPDGCVLFLDEVGERPYRLDRLFTQLRLSGVLARVSALVFGELPECDEPDGNITARQVIGELVNGFPGPVLYGLPSGHTSGATLTLPFGVRARVITGARPALVIEESAVEERPGV
jgi:muramoyltetrapeptide carboxypeptidase